MRYSNIQTGFFNQWKLSFKKFYESNIEIFSKFVLFSNTFWKVLEKLIQRKKY